MKFSKIPEEIKSGRRFVRLKDKKIIFSKYDDDHGVFYVEDICANDWRMLLSFEEALVEYKKGKKISRVSSGMQMGYENGAERGLLLTGNDICTDDWIIG